MRKTFKDLVIYFTSYVNCKSMRTLIRKIQKHEVKKIFDG